MVLFCEPAAVREIFQLPAERFECRPYNEQYRYVMGDKSILVSDGPRHRARRRLLIPQLHRAAVAALPQLIHSIVAQAFAEWPEGQPFSPRRSTHLLCLQIMLGVVFGDNNGGIRREITGLFRVEIFKDLRAWGPRRPFGQLQSQLCELIVEDVRVRRVREAANPGDLFDALVFARDETGWQLTED